MTHRQVEVAQLIAEGLTDRQIAGRLAISVSRAARHGEELREVLGARNRAHTVALAYRYRILSIDQEW